MTDDSDLERLMREGLHRRAEDADTTAPLAEQAKRGARRRRVGRLVVGVAALAVAAVAVTGVVIDRSSPGGDGTPDVADDPTSEPLPTEWRTEYWHDTQVEVPADWGWGGAPEPGYGDGPMACGAVATVSAQGVKLGRADPTLAYVGRPIAQTDLCTTYPDNNPAAGPPTSPYVWLGAAVEPGTVDLGDGYVQETVEVNGSTVTVASQDLALRDRILESATGGETCLSNLEAPPRVESMLTEGMGKVRSGLLCVYRSEVSDHYDLVYSRNLTAREGQEFEDSAYAADESIGCARNSLGSEYAVVTLTGDDPFGTQPVSQDYVVDTGCALIETSPGETHVLTEPNVRSWAGGGVAATMTGPSYTAVDWANPYFIGMLG